MNWSIIIFCYNEEQSIESVVLSSISFIKRYGNEHSEIIIVDDGSTDNTFHYCESIQKSNNSLIRIIRHDKNYGIGKALKSGYDSAKGEQICAIPGDGQFDIQELEAIQSIKGNQFISFYRKTKNYNIYRSILTNLNYSFNRLLLGVKLKDVNWIKVYSKKQLELVNYQLNSSLIESEIVGKLVKLDYEAIEIESKYLSRSGGQAKGGSINTLILAIKELVTLYRIISKFKIK